MISLIRAFKTAVVVAALTILPYWLEQAPAVFAQSSNPGSVSASLRQRLQNLMMAQNNAEIDWRNHHGLLVGRAESEGDRLSAERAEVQARRPERLQQFRQMSTHTRRLLAQAQAYIEALPPGADAIPPATERQLSLVQGALNQQNRLWQEYQSDFHRAYADTGATLGRLTDFRNFVTRRAEGLVSDDPIERDRPNLFTGRRGTSSERRRHVVPQPRDSQGRLLYQNRNYLSPDALDSTIIAASNDLQNWMGRRQRLRLLGNQRPADLPPLYVPNYVNYLLESQFIGTPSITAAQRNQVLDWYRTRLSQYRIIAASTTDPMLRIRRVLSSVVRDFLQTYHRDERGMLATLRGEGVNCQGRANLLYGVMSALNLELPRDWSLGVQMFTRHMELVLYNSTAHPPVIQLFNQQTSELTGPVYSPAVLLEDFVRTRNDVAAEFVPNDELLIAPADPGLARPSHSPNNVRINDGLGNTLPAVAGADFMDGPIPEYATNTAPDPEQEMQSATSGANSRSSGTNNRRTPLGIAVQAPPRQSRFTMANQLRTAEEIEAFCNSLSDDINAAGPSIESVDSYYWREAIRRLPSLALLPQDPGIVFQDQRLRNFLWQIQGNRNVRLGCTRLFSYPAPPAPISVYDSLNNHLVQLMNRGQWHKVVLLMRLTSISSSYQACTVLRNIDRHLIEVTDSPTPEDQDPPQAGGNPSTSAPSMPEHRFAFLPSRISAEILRGTPEVREAREPTSSRRMRINLEDLVGLTSSACNTEAFRFNLSRAVMEYVCSHPLISHRNFPLALSTFHFLDRYGDDTHSNLSAFIEEISNPTCTNENLQQLAQSLGPVLPFASHCSTVLPQRFTSQERRIRIRDVNRLVTLLNRRVPGSNLPTLRESDCPASDSTAPAAPSQGSGSAAPGM